MKLTDPAVPKATTVSPPDEREVLPLAESAPAPQWETSRARRAPASPPAAMPAPPPRQRWWLSLLILAILGGGGYYVYPRLKPYFLPANQTRMAPPARVIPVTAVPVVRADLDLHLDALGTVTAFNTVTIRSRVDGELIKVAFEEGQMVKAGDLLAEVDPRPFEIQLKEAEAQLAKDRASLALATADNERLKSLATSQAASRQQLDAQKAVIDQSQATIELDQGRIDNIKLQLTYCRIVAPMAGRIGLRRVDAGNIVQANDLMGLAVITQLEPISVVFPIPQDDVAPIQQKVAANQKLPVEAFDRGFETRLAAGSLTAIDNQVDVATGTVRLKAVFDNQEHLLFPNQFVNVRLLTDTLRAAVLAPTAAVQRGPGFTFVYVVQADSTVALREVTLGPTEGEQTAIQSGLEPGDLVVVDGVDKLQDGTKVEPRHADAEAEATRDAATDDAQTDAKAP